MRAINELRVPGSGLNRRKLMLGTKASFSTWAFLPEVLKSSSKMRTRTPRAAASRTAASSRSVVSS